jgi:tRNA(fMet)-specific endonuclease VapC
MRQYLLDTGPLVALIKGRPSAERLIRPWVAAQEVATSILVYGEAIVHFRTQPDFRRNREALRALLQTVAPLRLTYTITERYADLRWALRPRGALIGDVDTHIAATALEHGLTLVTLDGDFARIPGLALMLIERAALF